MSDKNGVFAILLATEGALIKSANCAAKGKAVLLIEPLKAFKAAMARSVGLSVFEAAPAVTGPDLSPTLSSVKKEASDAAAETVETAPGRT